MIKILVNDGMHPDGKILLESAGFQVDTEKIPQEALPEKLPDYDAILVRSATKVRKELIDACPKLKVIGRGGVGLDNIDVDYAESKGIKVINTPAASSLSVAELVFAHIFTLARSLHLSNRMMPQQGNSEFKKLKSAFSKGFELRGKTLGIIGYGRIGQETARIGLALGMEVIPVDLVVNEAYLNIDVFKSKEVSLTVKLETGKWENMLHKADIITLHVPYSGKAVLDEKDFEKMKDGVIIINASRGGTVDEPALLSALESGKVAAAGLDVFENEPTPDQKLLNHPRISVTPHIGASTSEAQRNIGLELANKLIGIFKNNL